MARDEYDSGAYPFDDRFYLDSIDPAGATLADFAPGVDDERARTATEQLFRARIAAAETNEEAERIKGERDAWRLKGGYVAYDEPVQSGCLHDLIEQSIASAVPTITIIPHDILESVMRAEGERVLQRAKKPRLLRG